MQDLSVSLGWKARDAMCRAFRSAKHSIEAEFYSLDDRKVEQAINTALLRSPGLRVHLRVEGFPKRYADKSGMNHHLRSRGAESAGKIRRRLQRQMPGALIEVEVCRALVHAKAAVVDGKSALISTANPNRAGFKNAGEVCVEDRRPADVASVTEAIEGNGKLHGSRARSLRTGCRIVAGPQKRTRIEIQGLLDAPGDLCIATEDLSDARVIETLVIRAAESHHDRVLINGKAGMSQTAAAQLDRLAGGHVDVRVMTREYMHEKYIDAGDRIFVGSHNLTRNGLDEAREVGIIAPASDFGRGGLKLRADFERLWAEAPLVCQKPAASGSGRLRVSRSADFLQQPGAVTA